MSGAALTSQPVGESSAGFRQLFRAGGTRRLTVAMLFSRTASEAFYVGIVLFVLAEFHSAPLAGLAVFFSLAPGLVASPVTGALLDRRGMTGMIIVDFLVSAGVAAALAILSWAHALSPALVLLLAAAGSLTSPLSFSGLRRALPALLPKELWGRGFAIDAVTSELAMIFGPVIAGVLVGAASPQVAMIVIAVGWCAGAVAMSPVSVNAARRNEGSILSSARAGLSYLVGNPTLRGIAASLGPINLGTGAVIVAVPLIVFRLHAGAASVGVLWAITGFASGSMGMYLGRSGIQGIEKRVYVGGCILAVAAIGTLLWSPNLVIASMGMLFFGLSNGAINIPAWTMRQHRTDPRILGRVVAISISLNVAGIPIGAALAGAVIQHSLTLTLAAGAVLAVTGTLIAVCLIPAHDQQRDAGVSA